MHSKTGAKSAAPSREQSRLQAATLDGFIRFSRSFLNPRKGRPFAAYALTYAKSEASVISERHVKLFKNGRNQAVRIPREFELPGEDAIMRKEGERLIIEPAPPKSLLALLATLAPLDEEFPAIPDTAPDPIEL
jgi:antitoxin VapB